MSRPTKWGCLQFEIGCCEDHASSDIGTDIAISTTGKIYKLIDRFIFDGVRGVALILIFDPMQEIKYAK